MKFRSEDNFKHSDTDKIGILLVNLGTPDNPDVASIRRFLKEFLSDHRVIEIPALLWKVILYGFILPFRPKKLVPLYQGIWTDEGSPLIAISKKQQQQLSNQFKNQKNISIALAMRYGNPDIASALAKLANDNVRKLLILPVYAQYSGTTTASIFDAVTKELHRWRWVPELRFINSYHDNKAYINALANSVKAHWQEHGKSKKLLMSFHGIPKRNLILGDPYYCQCHKTARLLAAALGLREDEWLLSFQSRFGKAEWLKPYTTSTLRHLAKEGEDSVDIICPGFAIDCLETLEEIEVENREVFIQAGGKNYHYIPALNDSKDHVEALYSIIQQHIQGWETEQSTAAMSQREQLALSKGADR